MGKRLDGRHNEDASERQSCLASMCGGSEGVCLQGRQGLKVRLRVSPASLTAKPLSLPSCWPALRAQQEALIEPCCFIPSESFLEMGHIL